MIASIYTNPRVRSARILPKRSTFAQKGSRKSISCRHQSSLATVLKTHKDHCAHVETILCPVQVKEAIVSFLQEHPHVSPYQDSAFFIKNISALIAQNIGRENKELLCNMGKKGTPDIVLIENFPVDTVIPQADTIQERLAKKGYVSEAAMLGTAGLMGYKLLSYPHEQEGRVVHNIAPVKEKLNTASSKGIEPFFLHTESAYEKNPPEFLILVGLEGDPTAKTAYFRVQDFIKNLPEEVIYAMKQPDFEIRAGAGVDGTTKGTFSLLTEEKDSGKTRLRLYQNMKRIKPLTKRAADTLKYLENAFCDVEKIPSIGLQEGQAIIFNNGWTTGEEMHGVLHGREGKISNFNRWLQRGFLYDLKIETLHKGSMCSLCLFYLLTHQH